MLDPTCYDPQRVRHKIYGSAIRVPVARPVAAGRMHRKDLSSFHNILGRWLQIEACYRPATGAATGAARLNVGAFRLLDFK